MPRAHLFYSLLTENLHGKVLTVLHNMYSKLKPCVGTDGNVNEFFRCKVGTQKGFMKSQISFTLYLN